MPENDLYQPQTFKDTQGHTWQIIGRLHARVLQNKTITPHDLVQKLAIEHPTNTFAAITPPGGETELVVGEIVSQTELLAFAGTVEHAISQNQN